MARPATVGRWATAIGALGVATVLAATAISHRDAARPAPILVADAADEATPHTGAFHEVEPTRVVTGDARSDPSLEPGAEAASAATAPAEGTGAGPAVTTSTTVPDGTSLPGGDVVTDLPGTGVLADLLDPLLGGGTTTTVPGSGTTTTTGLLGLPLPITPPPDLLVPLPPLLPGL